MEKRGRQGLENREQRAESSGRISRGDAKARRTRRRGREERKNFYHEKTRKDTKKREEDQRNMRISTIKEDTLVDDHRLTHKSCGGDKTMTNIVNHYAKTFNCAYV